MVSWPVTLTGSSCSVRTGAGMPDFLDCFGGVVAAGESALANAGHSVAANIHNIAIPILLSAGFRKQPTPPLAGQKIRVNFADKIHRTGSKRHVIRPQFRNYQLNRAHRIAL